MCAVVSSSTGDRLVTALTSLHIYIAVHCGYLQQSQSRFEFPSKPTERSTVQLDIEPNSFQSKCQTSARVGREFKPRDARTSAGRSGAAASSFRQPS
ncbi:hypothetical protein EVAR_42806_1 [Eumeta japonica]|uniref:Uncharacterized protein n=1 Tax=Eumeta variegata TaxID=151549 RepID=A0A4C1WJ38_EUMVA|nr:hypothetical protein EVAR_42806_1 [Eumeta japonica]